MVMTTINKRHLHHVWRQLRYVSYWYFLIAAVICGLLFVFAYRNNNLTALKLRDQLISADKAGNHVQESLNTLRSYIYGHMNANLAGGPGAIYPPIQLQGTYERAVASAKQKADTANAEVAAKAQSVCNQQFPGASTGYLLCVQTYEADHQVKPQQIPDSLYKFDFAAPRWSPDLAGWMLVLTTLFFIIFLIRLVLEFWLRYNLKQHE